jgi:hypothetical protein
MSPTDDAAFIVAHELAVIATRDKGYPYLRYKVQCETVEMYVSEMIWTPLRDSMLAEYGLNVTREFYTFRVPPVFSASCIETSDPIGQLQNGCLYVMLVLYWQDVLGNQGTPSDIENRYSQCFPKSLIIGKGILAIINEIGGYDTPAKAKAIFQRVIDEYNLQDCICVS